MEILNSARPMTASTSAVEVGEGTALRETGAGRLAPIAWRPLAGFAVVTIVVHLLIAGRYGWFRDELYYIEAGKHLSGGYVEFPVMVVLLADLQRFLFGTSIAAIHVLPAFAGAGILIVTGLMARELGGGKVAQTVAALAALTTPAFVGADALFTMDAFDQLWWTLAAYLLVRILGTYGDRGAFRTTARTRRNLWLLFGLVCGLGLLTKLTILAFGLAVVVALLLSEARKELRTPWPYIGGMVAALFLVPYVLWQLGHDWPTLAFWRSYSHGQDTLTFAVQVVLLMQPLALPLWSGGLWRLARNPRYRVYRPLAWIWVFLVALFVVGHAKSYFLVPAFPPLLAAGAVAVEELSRRRPNLHLVGVTSAALIIGGVVLAPVVAPILPANTLAAITRRPIQPVADRFGWPQYVRTVARVYRNLPARDRGDVTILTGNYGEAGALDLLGPRYHLPVVISPHNTYWFWGKGVRPKRTVIATDFRRTELLRLFRTLRSAATVPSQDGIQNEEVGRVVWICSGRRVAWSHAWRRLQNFS